MFLLRNGLRRIMTEALVPAAGNCSDDYRVICDRSPGPCMVFDTSFRVLAQNEAHARATLTKPEQTIGRSLFDIFPDNPNDSSANGLAQLRASLLKVLNTRERDAMPLIKYDVERPGTGGLFEVRYWEVANTPLLDSEGYVCCIINQAEDVTELVRQGTLTYRLDI